MLEMEVYEQYVGRVFDNRYRIEKVIGIGGMAIVFKATDLLMRRTVAVKILKDEFASDDQSVRSFINESKTIAMLSHSNIVNIYDVSVRENIKFIVMEFVEGITLKNYMEHREVLNLREIISYTTQILRALDHAHKKGIVHRDIKPQNIMLLKNGVIKVMDFGIAKRPNTETITMTGKAIGTVYYISPEQVSGTEIDCRSDLYSLGAMMYEMATGQLPFTAETPVSVALMQVNEDPVPPREVNPYIPQGLEQIILRAMEKDPDERYQSAEEMLGQLQKLRENPKIVFRENKSKLQKQKKENSQPKKKHKTSRAMFPIILGVTLAFLIAAGIGAYWIFNKLITNGSLQNYREVTVYEYVGHRYTEQLDDWFAANKAEYKVNLIYEFVKDAEKQPKGTIIAQEPLAGEKRKVYSGKQPLEMTLTISEGEHIITLADYSVRDYRLVESELKRLKLRVRIENVPNSVYEIGYVIRTEPEAGSELKENDIVKIYVSYGSDAAMTTVPDFKGMTEAQALIESLRSHLTVGEVTYKLSWSPVGTVLKQSVAASSVVPEFEVVNFEISGGGWYNRDGKTVPVKVDYTYDRDHANEVYGMVDTGSSSSGSSGTTTDPGTSTAGTPAETVPDAPSGGGGSTVDAGTGVDAGAGTGTGSGIHAGSSTGGTGTGSGTGPVIRPGTSYTGGGTDSGNGNFEFDFSDRGDVVWDGSNFYGDGYQ